MGQVLKESRRRKIISSAIEEFYNNGIDASSMRVIAKNSDMSVGNLYRYFKNKHELAKYIIDPVLQKLNNLDFEIKLNAPFPSEQAIKSIDLQKLTEIVNWWAENLAYAMKQYRKEMYIIINDEKINETNVDYFTKLVKCILNYAQPSFAKSELSIDMLSQVLVKSIYSGLSEAIKFACNNEDITDQEFLGIIKYYLNGSFMLFAKIEKTN